MLSDFDKNDDISLINELNESTLIRHEKMYEKYTLQDITDLLFLYLIVLKILNSEFEFAPVAVKYAKGTMMFGGNFTQLRRTSTDLYLLIHQLFHRDISKLKNPEANQLYAEKIDTREQDIVVWLRRMAHNQANDNFDRRFFFKLQNSLNITNTGYKAVRRLAVDWNDLSRSDKRLVMTRLLLAFRTKARRSELLPYLETLAKKQKLEIKDANNPEKFQDGDTKGGSKLLKGLALAATAVLGYKAGKALTSGKVREDCSDGATSSGNIASTTTVLNQPILRRQNQKDECPYCASDDIGIVGKKHTCFDCDNTW